MTAADVVEILRKACGEARSMRSWAIERGVSPTYVSDVLRGHREPGGRLLDALGIERVVTYRRVRRVAENG